ncbi:MAG: DUF5317 family protein [Candidatus Spechtbacterales bacterium]|nr:DUF5317 family protein [Candidatus Spechtbacterales bacterium]
MLYSLWTIVAIFFVYKIFFTEEFLWHMFFYTIFLVSLFIVYVFNTRAPGFLVGFIGGCFNWLVVMANGGMPVPREATQNLPVGYTYINDDTVLLPLADIFENTWMYYSIGDIIIFTGIGMLFLQLFYFIVKNRVSKQQYPRE